MQPTISFLRRLPTTLLLLMTPAYYLVPWERMGWRGESLAVFFVLAYTVVLPGVVIHRAVGRRGEDALSDFAQSTMYGLAFLLLVMFLWTLSGLSLPAITPCVPIAVAAAVILGSLRRPTPAEDPAARARMLPVAVFITLLVVVAFGVLRAGVPIDFGSDTIDHVGYVHEIQETGEAFPTTAFYAEGGDNGKDIRKGFLHAFYGYASAYAGMDALRFMNLINAVFAILLLLVVYAVTLHWFKDNLVALVAAGIFAFCATGGLSTLLLRVAYYPSRFGIVFFLFLLASALDYLWHRRRAELPRLAVFAFAACAAHVFFGVMIAFFGGLLLVWKNCFPFNDRATHYRSVAMIGMWIMVGALPVCLYRYLTDFPQANDLHTNLQGVLLIGPLFVAESTVLFRYLGPLGLASILCAIPLWRRKGAHPAIGFMVASGITIPLVLLNPVVLPVLHRFMTYLTFRIALLFPFYILAAYYLIGYVRERFGHRGGDERMVTAGFASTAVAIILALALVVQIIPGVGAAASWTRSRESEARQSYRLWADGLAFLDTEIPPGSIIASDPLTGYTVPAFTSNYVVCALDQHVPPNDLRLPERITAARDILSPFVSMKRTLQRLDETGANYVVLNKRFGSGLLLHYWTMDASVFDESVRKFETFPDLFDRVFDSEDFVVFKRRGAGTTREDIAPNRWRLDAIPAGYKPIGRVSGVARLEAARTGAEASAGSEVTVALVWSGEGNYQLDNYVVSLRFDHVAAPLPLGGKPFPKIARKVIEMFTGERYRYRSDHKLAGGFLSPDVWKPGDLIDDEVTIRLPTNLARGEYTVQAKLHILPHEPVYKLRDLLDDDDLFAGVEIGRITVH